MRNKQGDLSKIIKSVDGLSVGKIVQCVSYEGKHSQHGDIWLVSCKDPLVSEYGAVGNRMHMPDDWMVPIKPGELDNNTIEKKELTVQ